MSANVSLLIFPPAYGFVFGLLGVDTVEKVPDHRRDVLLDALIQQTTACVDRLPAKQIITIERIRKDQIFASVAGQRGRGKPLSGFRHGRWERMSSSRYRRDSLRALRPIAVRQDTAPALPVISKMVAYCKA
jgi:hypothetical protein